MGRFTTRTVIPAEAGIHSNPAGLAALRRPRSIHPPAHLPQLLDRLRKRCRAVDAEALDLVAAMHGKPLVLRLRLHALSLIHI